MRRTSPICPWPEASATWWRSWTGPAAGCFPSGSRTPWTPRFASRLWRKLSIAYDAPEIMNTDQGAQFTSEGFTSLLLARGVAISMDGRGRWLDNVFIERLWRSVKYEEVYLKAYESIPEARKELAAYFDFYNKRRRHQGLENRTPDEVYWSTLRKQQQAA